MKKLLSAAAAVGALLAAPTLAHAEIQYYASAGYAAVDIDPVNLAGFQGRFGAEITPYIAIEGEAAFGLKGDEVAGIDVDLDSEVALFGVAKVPVGESFTVLARVGYSKTKINVGGTDVSGDGVAYGVGGEYFLNDNDGFRADYTRHDADGGDADVWSIAYVHKF